jgi:NAD-dependent SIR2 family protein deacetylase
VKSVIAEELVKTYDKGKVRALDGLSLDVEEGTVLSVLGPNGAGKTTTVRILSTLLRPDTVLFGEHLPIQEEWLVKKALRNCDLFIAIGTSGTVSPVSNYVRSADYAGARTILINLEPMEPKNPYFHEEYLGLAEEILPLMFDIK